MATPLTRRSRVKFWRPMGPPVASRCVAGPIRGRSSPLCLPPWLSRRSGRHPGGHTTECVPLATWPLEGPGSTALALVRTRGRPAHAAAAPLVASPPPRWRVAGPWCPPLRAWCASVRSSALSRGGVRPCGRLCVAGGRIWSCLPWYLSVVCLWWRRRAGGCAGVLTGRQWWRHPWIGGLSARAMTGSSDWSAGVTRCRDAAQLSMSRTSTAGVPSAIGCVGISPRSMADRMVDRGMPLSVAAAVIVAQWVMSGVLISPMI